jgi:hypothetical protein
MIPSSVMKNALYFPYTHVRTEKLFKSALLLWDQLEYVVPYAEYPIDYTPLAFNRDDARTLQEAHCLVCREHVPTAEENQEANERIIELATTPNLPPWFLKTPSGMPRFAVHFGKLFEETWEALRQLGMEIYVRDDKDLEVPTAFGRASMTILAQSCSGHDTELVTDSDQATASVRNTTEIEGRSYEGISLDSEQTYFSAVEALNFINVDAFTLQQLIDFRAREKRERTPYQGQFRRNYWEQLDKSVAEYRNAKNEAERDRVRDRFRSAMKSDFQFLKEELGLSTAEVLFEIDPAALVSLGAAIVGGPVGVLATFIAGLRSASAKITGYVVKKKTTELKHSSSYLYVFKNVVNEGKPLRPSTENSRPRLQQMLEQRQRKRERDDTEID